VGELKVVIMRALYVTMAMCCFLSTHCVECTDSL